MKNFLGNFFKTEKKKKTSFKQLCIRQKRDKDRGLPEQIPDKPGTVDQQEQLREVLRKR